MVGEKRIYENDVGVKFIVMVVLPNAPLSSRLADADVIKLYVKKPSGTEVVWNATKCDSGGGTGGDDNTLVALSYTTVDGDLNEAGQYKLHAYVAWGSTSKHHGQVATFKVYKKFDTST